MMSVTANVVMALVLSAVSPGICVVVAWFAMFVPFLFVVVEEGFRRFRWWWGCSSEDVVEESPVPLPEEVVVFDAFADLSLCLHEELRDVGLLATMRYPCCRSDTGDCSDEAEQCDDDVVAHFVRFHM
jgi:hypothetical protein